MDGILRAINVSDGGVPKLPRQSCEVRSEGLAGDRQRDLRHHGGPSRAVSLYALERIEALRAEGHPIAAGTIGENLTLSGVPWEAMVPGTRVEVGGATLEMTGYAAPCRNIAGSFRDGAFERVSQKKHPGWSRLYAAVLKEGLLRVGDPVRIIKAPAPV